MSEGCIATDSMSSGVRVWVIFCAVPGLLQHPSQLDADRIDEPWKNRTGGLCGAFRTPLLDMCFHTCQSSYGSLRAGSLLGVPKRRLLGTWRIGVA